MANGQDATFGQWNRNWFREVEAGQEGRELRQLITADQQGQASVGREQASCDWQHPFETLHGSQGHYVGGGGGELLGSLIEDFHARQSQGAGGFAEEGSLLVIRFDEREMKRGRPDFQRESGEAGAGAEIRDPRRFPGGREEAAGGQKGFPEMSCNDIFFAAHGSQVQAGVPAQEYIDIRRYTGELGGREISAKRFQESGDVGMIHAEIIVEGWRWTAHLVPRSIQTRPFAQRARERTGHPQVFSRSSIIAAWAWMRCIRFPRGN